MTMQTIRKVIDGIGIENLPARVQPWHESSAPSPKKYREIEVDTSEFKYGWSCRVTYPSGAQKVVATRLGSESAAFEAGIHHAKEWYEIEEKTNSLLWLAR